MTAKPLKKIEEYHNDMMGWRRDIHRNPEIAFKEFETSDYIANLLEEWGIEIHRGLAETAVIGVLHGDKGAVEGKSKTIALRADMDALEIHECTGLSYTSKNEGKMHGCGHDGHTAMLLGAARYLSEHKDFEGTVHFIFQPAEESEGGARVMVEEGYFDKFPCAAIFGMHNWPGIPLGQMGICEGPLTAAADRFKITISGKGGHAAMPHNNIDVITIASTIVTSLQTLISRQKDPLKPAVLSICKFHAGTDSLNVMPETVDLGGTIRTFDTEVQNTIEENIKIVSEKIASAYGATISYDYVRGYPSVVNSPEETKMAAVAASEIVGVNNMDTNFTPTMAAEDFAFFLQKSPGAYIVLGQDDGDKKASLHSPHYDFNDKALSIGASYWVKLVENFMAR